ncbi:MAG: YebC/PmpR family DNA-binding transcriptional regulator [Planctomycetota bacterium]|nr:YebC/PmpR family DNA-binding transcriptional regulator [Planctomycetota bacterium]MDA0934385.1 YebC/PmpR family DNA-binding transcriptional regulator [Planctomycetota bacterium]
MAGHSHSANIKYRKERVNAAKAKAFSKVARMITVAARLGGGDPDGNSRLRLALEKARLVSMPKDNIERAIKKGVGDADTSNFEEVLYEGFAPCGVAVLLEILTDNRSRTAPEIRRILDRAGGNLGSSGSVAWMFERKAVFSIAKQDGLDEERLMDLVLESGAEDFDDLGESFQIRCEPGQFEAVREAFSREGFEVQGGEIAYLPKTSTVLGDVADARRVIQCLDALEDNDDVQSVYSNQEFSEQVLEELTSGQGR